MLTKTGMDKILRRIYETGGLTEDMEKDIDRIRTDFDEREGLLRNYGEVYDGEDMDEYDFAPRDTDTVYTPDEEEKIDWEGKYNEMKKRYVDRFFGTDEVREKDAEIDEETEEDVKRDGTSQSFDELLTKVEGDK